MLHPDPRNPEVAGSQTGPPGQDSGGDPDRSQSHIESWTTVCLEPMPGCCASGLRVWEAEGIFPHLF